ncbi:MAG: substrate-binding domain-containing protein, partial [Caulobacteraceae bacterium]
AKAKQVVGGRMEPAAPAGAASTALASLDRYQVDVMIGYCSSHSTKDDPSVAHVQLPPDLAVPVDYGMTVLTGSPDLARREAAGQLALYLMSPEAQVMMKPYGFIPVAALTPAS